MSLFYKKKLIPYLALLFSLSVLIAAVAIEATHSQPFSFFIAVFSVVAIQFLCYLFILNSSPKALDRRLLAGSILIFGSVLFLRFCYSQEFLKSAFHGAAQLYIIILYRKEDRYRGDKSKDSTRFLLAFGVLVVVAALFWIVAMGYNIIFLSMPGSRDWMLFNFYSLVNILIAVDALVSLYHLLHIQVRIWKEGIKIDQIEYSNLLSPGDLAILNLYASHETRCLTCSDIVAALDCDGKKGKDHKTDECHLCIAQNHKATLCSNYKRIYNQIHKIKRLLETTNVGTIVSPENKTQILQRGWTLKIFEKVKLYHSKAEL